MTTYLRLNYLAYSSVQILSWDCCVAYLLQKVVKPMYCVDYLVGAGVPVCDIVYVYCSIIHSVLEDACPVWHRGLTK